MELVFISISSMTGFGSAFQKSEGRELTIELKSFNNRFLDISIRSPRSLSFLEDEIRSALQRTISRGHIDVSVNYQNNRTDNKTVNVDRSLLKEYLDTFKSVQKEYGIKNDVAVSDIIKINDIFTVTQNQDDQEALVVLCKATVNEAAAALKEMRNREGEKLKDDLLAKLKGLDQKVRQIETRAPSIVTEYKNKLTARISELLDGTNIDEQRLAQEVAYFADKAAIDEEIVRMYSHIKQMETALSSSEPVGRKLDFIVQEMNREINTIGSKAGDLIIVNLIVDIKSELEKMREQVQNIE